ncbi:MAG TPA: cell wall metabolism sensor histidine kinase WalK [Firmicutes bacterium]|nr:cell wall metabolism sensor histidine kinase WalK [Bacillota bacterium]
MATGRLNTNTVFMKLFKVNLAIVLMTLTALGLLLSYSFESFYLDIKAREFMAQASQIAQQVIQLAGQPGEQPGGLFTGLPPSQQGRVRLRLSDYLNLTSRFIDGEVWIVDKDGLILAGSSGDKGPVGSRLGYTEIKRVLSGHRVVHKGDFPYFGESVLSVAVPIVRGEMGKKQVTGAVFVCTPVAGVTSRMGRVKEVILRASLIAIVLAILFAAALSRNFARRLIELDKAALEMASGNFEKRIKVKAPDEIGRLAQTFNFVMERLKATVEALHEERDKRDYILKSMSEGVIAIDRDGKIMLVNPAAERMFGINWMESGGRELSNRSNKGSKGKTGNDGCGTGEVEINQVEAGADVAPWFSVLQRSLFTGDQASGEFSLDDGSIILARAAPVMTSGGEAIGSVGVFRDISESRKLEQLQRDFVANASHELRTPLTTIRGFAKMLLDGLVAERGAQKRYIKIIVDESDRLTRLVNQLLDLSRIDAGRLEIERKPVNIKDLVERTIRTVRARVAEAHISLSVNIPNDLGLILGDEERLEQVLLNLIDNAVEFTPAGGRISVEASKDAGGGFEGVIIRVRDTGPGIPREEIDRIWDRFYRVQGIPGRSSSGTGLGLAIVKEIVKAHGGEVGVESETGKGSMFWVKLRS